MKIGETALGAADYIALASAFDAVVLSDVPCFGADEVDRARRFITFLDAMYERRTLLVCEGAHGRIDDVFAAFAAAA